MPNYNGVVQWVYGSCVDVDEVVYGTKFKKKRMWEKLLSEKERRGKRPKLKKKSRNIRFNFLIIEEIPRDEGKNYIHIYIYIHTKSNVKLGGFRSQLRVSYVSSHTEELWDNETVCLWMRIYIYITYWTVKS